MIKSEFGVLLHWIAMCSPGSRQEPDAAEAWLMIFEQANVMSSTLEDAKTAVAMVAGRQPFVAPSEVISELRRVRRERIEHAVVPAPAIDDADGNEVPPEDYNRELRHNIAQIADLHPMPRAQTSTEAYNPVYLGPGSDWRRSRDAKKAIAAPVLVEVDPAGAAALDAAKSVLNMLPPERGASLLEAARDEIAMSGTEMTTSTLIITAASLATSEASRDAS